MRRMAFVPLVAALISILFALQVGRQWVTRRKPYQLLWTIALLLYAIAAYGEFSSLAFGWSVLIYKVYFFSAMTLVAYMGVGEIYLLLGSKSKIALATLCVACALTVLFVIQLASAKVALEVLHNSTVTIGGQALPSGITNLYGIAFSAVGGLVLIVGSCVSWWKSKRSSALMIAFGACVLSLAGTFAKMGYPVFLPISELIGITFLFYGFVSASKGSVAGRLEAKL